MISFEKEKLLKKLKEGKCAEEELEQLFRLVAQLPRSESLELMDILWQYVDHYPELERKLSEKMYDSVLSRINETTDPDASDEQKMTVWIRRNWPLLRWTGVAAAILVGLFSFWLWSNQVSLTTIATTSAKQRTIYLPDGSTVQLNANSTLSYKDNWERNKDRTVWLQGEAFFEVTEKHESGQKFQVITPDLMVEVLGTVFNVNSYHEQTDVYLEEGKISLKLKDNRDGRKVLKPGEMLAYSSKKGAIIAYTKSSSPNLITSWKDGVLIFERTPFAEVIRKVETIYSIDFQVKDSANYQRDITAGLPMEDLEVVLPLLERALNLKIRKSGEVYLIE